MCVCQVKEGEDAPTKTVPKTTNVWEKVNVAKPLWMRPPKEVTDEEYDEFYKTCVIRSRSRDLWLMPCHLL